MATETNRREARPAAFPHVRIDGHPDYAPGLTIRDYFAAQAIIGLLGDGMIEAISEGNAVVAIKNAAKISYGIADAMLEARNR